VVPPDDLQLLLRETTRRLKRLNRELLSLANQLGAVLRETAPELLDLCGGANEPFFWDLAELATDDLRARRLRQSQVQRILSRHRIRRLGAEAVLTALRTPRLWCSAGRRQADLDEVACLVPLLRAVHRQVERCRQEVEHLLAQAGPDVAILRSFPGLGPIVAATLLGEAYQAIEERDLQGLRTRCGLAPVTTRSGQSGSVRMRRACSGALRDACFHWAKTAARVDPWARSLYQAARARGHSEGRALRTLGDRLLARLVAALRSGTTFQPPAPPAAGPSP
jgi:transposase